jgi:hypothetical protein
MSALLYDMENEAWRTHPLGTDRYIARRFRRDRWNGPDDLHRDNAGTKVFRSASDHWSTSTPSGKEGMVTILDMDQRQRIQIDLWGPAELSRTHAQASYRISMSKTCDEMAVAPVFFEKK